MPKSETANFRCPICQSDTILTEDQNGTVFAFQCVMNEQHRGFIDIATRKAKILTYA